MAQHAGFDQGILGDGFIAVAQVTVPGWLGGSAFGKAVLRVQMKKARMRVTWNGRGFDLPVLKQRSLVYGLQAHAWHRTDPRYGYDYRYESRWHCDLMDVLCDNGASARLGLHEAAVAIGLPGKMEAASGSEVGAMLETGDHDRINRYCEGDVLNTYALYLRWAYLSSVMSARGHNASVRDLVDYLERERLKRPHLGEFLDAWQASSRPCPLYVEEPATEPGAQPPESHLRSEDVLP